MHELFFQRQMNADTYCVTHTHTHTHTHTLGAWNKGRTSSLPQRENVMHFQVSRTLSSARCQPQFSSSLAITIRCTFKYFRRSSHADYRVIMYDRTILCTNVSLQETALCKETAFRILPTKAALELTYCTQRCHIWGQ